MNGKIKILLGRKRKIVYAAIAAVVILIFLAFYKMRSSKDNEFLFTPPAVTVSEATFGPVSKYVNAIGTLRPFDSVVIKSEVDAKIEKIHFQEGAIVKENDLLIELDDSTAKAELMDAEASYRRAKSEFEPKDRLADKGIAARVERDKAKAEMDKCAAAVDARKAILDKHKIRAPFGGVVGLKEISRGQFVSRNVDLVKIVDCHPIKVDFKVAEVDVEKLYVDQEAQISVGGDTTKMFVAKINAIDPESDKISHSFDVRAILDVPEEIALTSQILKPGRFVSVRIVIDGEQQGILVPESALEKTGDEDMLYRVVEGKTAIRTPVTVGTRRDGNVEIITGVNEGDLVITTGQAGVLDGKEVAIKNSSSSSDILDAVKEIERLKIEKVQKQSKRVK
jgi:membrane fusion protein (multidrug efflux system)